MAKSNEQPILEPIERKLDAAAESMRPILEQILEEAFTTGSPGGEDFARGLGLDTAPDAHSDAMAAELRRVQRVGAVLLDTICAIGLAIGLPDPSDPAVSDDEGLAAWSGKLSVKVAALRDTAGAGRVAELERPSPPRSPPRCCLAHKGDAAAAVRALRRRIGQAREAADEAACHIPADHKARAAIDDLRAILLGATIL